MAEGSYWEIRRVRKLQRIARTLYTKKKHEKFVVSHKRTPPERKRKLKGQIRPWSHLPSDLLISEVMSRLSSFDQIRIRGVCKNWGLLPTHPPITQQDNLFLPWLLNYHWDDHLFPDGEPTEFVCKLFDASHAKPYSVDQVIGEDIRPSCCVPRIHSSKHGWLLLSWEKTANIGKFLTSYFLFSPFTKQIITLPDLNYSIRSGDNEPYFRDHIATFSSDPYSPDCIFFDLRLFFCGTFTISTCHPLDSTWTTQKFEGPQYGTITDLVFSGGCLYFVIGFDGALASFSVANHDVSLVTTNSNLHLPTGNCHLFECKGHLFLAYLDQTALEGNDNGQCRLFRLSESQRAWVAADTSFLGNQALFLGRTSSFSVEASGETTNKVYYHACDGRLRFYSLEDGKNHTLEGSLYTGWLGAKGRNQGIWIQSPQLPTKLEFAS